jgi:hypothetical protein
MQRYCNKAPLTGPALEPAFWLAASPSRVGFDQRLTRGIGCEIAAFKSCRNKSISDGVSIRGVFEVASF